MKTCLPLFCAPLLIQTAVGFAAPERAPSTFATHALRDVVYDGRINGKEVLTPNTSGEPRFAGATIFGVRPGKPIRFRVSATGEKPMQFSASGLPEGVTIDPASGWISGRAPAQARDVVPRRTRPT